MDKRKMSRLCDKLTDVNAEWEASPDNHSGKARVDCPLRRSVVGRWMWCALMHLDYMGYDVVMQKKPQRATKARK